MRGVSLLSKIVTRTAKLVDGTLPSTGHTCASSREEACPARGRTARSGPGHGRECEKRCFQSVAERGWGTAPFECRHRLSTSIGRSGENEVGGFGFPWEHAE